MKRLALALLACALSALHSVRAERGLSFGIEAFRATASYDRDGVFSPVGAEFDCAILSEMLDSIAKSRYVESLGAIVGYENIYHPLVPAYAESLTNNYGLVTARALLVRYPQQIERFFARTLFDTWRTGVCPTYPNVAGAQAWFRASLDGRFEDFTLDGSLSEVREFSFVEAATFDCPWAEAFAAPTNGWMTGVQDVAVAEMPHFTLLRLPMANGHVFYAIKPPEGQPLAPLSDEIRGAKIDGLLLLPDSLVVKGAWRGRAAVTLPVLEQTTVTDLHKVLIRFKLPLETFRLVRPSHPPRLFEQRARLRLAARGLKPAATDGAERAFDFSGPFIYWIIHEPTRTMSVAGVHGGRGK